ncbi:MAG: D-2-hydroxyacid dehydrogenase family protein [Burkholderiaceae bacterium]|nr:D-2-hydroxyacid dehydrogenase family protein [Burkholderiaceae bacterium]
MKKIAILDDYQDSVRQLACFRLLDGCEVKVFTNSARGLGQLAIRLAEFDALVLIRERTLLTAALMAKLPRLKLIAQTGRLGANVDLAAATAAGIAVAEGHGDPTAPAELTWALVMAAMRKIPQYAGHLRNGHWQTASFHASHNTLGSTLKGKTLGIWGYGKIGRLVAGYGKAFGMHVVVWGRDASRAMAAQDGYALAASKEALFADADVLSLHLRLHDNTRAIVTAEDLARMKTSALLVNTSRAELIAPGALQAALEQGRPGFAALDVFDNEPLASDSPLLRMDNVLATPHLGYVEQNSYELYFRSAFENIINFSQGRPSGIANPEVLQS